MANQQDEPQRLLLVLAKTDSKDLGHEGQRSGTISPVVCVDKLPEEIESFESLVAEADQFSSDWDMILCAGLSGADGKPPTSVEAEPHLDKMVEDVRMGQDLSKYLILDRNEHIVNMQLQQALVRH
ncbi:MAG: ribonucleotide reductase subunit alpha [Thiohalocapsa sp.]